MKNKQKYVVMKTMNQDNGHDDYLSYDLYFQEKGGYTFIAKFELEHDAKLFANLKNYLAKVIESHDRA